MHSGITAECTRRKIASHLHTKRRANNTIIITSDYMGNYVSRGRIVKDGRRARSLYFLSVCSIKVPCVRACVFVERQVY